MLSPEAPNENNYGDDDDIRIEDNVVYRSLAALKMKDRLDQGHGEISGVRQDQGHGQISGKLL